MAQQGIFATKYLQKEVAACYINTKYELAIPKESKCAITNQHLIQTCRLAVQIKKKKTMFN